MAKQPQRARPAEKSKTDLRRGQFAPGMSGEKKAVTPRRGSGTTPAEQAMLFDEPQGGGT